MFGEWGSFELLLKPMKKEKLKLYDFSINMLKHGVIWPRFMSSWMHIPSLNGSSVSPYVWQIIKSTFVIAMISYKQL